MVPMVTGSGMAPLLADQIARPSTKTPKTPMLRPLSSAARAHHCSAMPSTSNDTP